MMRYLSLLSLLVVACSDQVSAPSKQTPTAPTTPTAPIAQPGPLAEWLNVSSPIIRGGGASARSVAYVSLPPGHVSATDSVFLTNRRTGLVVSPVVSDGGFDPVAIDAALNDTVDVTDWESATARATHTLGVVAARSALRLVRTDPVNGSNAVAIDASVVAVFSEPLNPAALSGGIHLGHIGEAVPSALTVDSSGTRVTLKPLAMLASGEPYDLYVSTAIAGVTGATPAVVATVSFETVLIGDDTAMSQVIGEWDASSWRFTDVNNPGIWDDPVVGWGPSWYYRLHLTVGAAGSGSPGAVLWRLTMSWQLGADTGSTDIRGTASIGTSWWFGRTTQSPWLQYTTPCQAGWICPLQNYDDFRMNGNTLTLTRRDSSLSYEDGINQPWPAREVLTLQRAKP
jgi:Bacterial Ig-like domain